jgi:hypothetical protein
VALGFLDHRYTALQVQAEERCLARNYRGPDTEYGYGDYEYQAPNEGSGTHSLAFFARGPDTAVPAGVQVVCAPVVDRSG